MICISRHVGGHAFALQHGGQNYFLLISCSTFHSYAQMCCKRYHIIFSTFYSFFKGKNHIIFIFIKRCHMPLSANGLFSTLGQWKVKLCKLILARSYAASPLSSPEGEGANPITFYTQRLRSSFNPLAFSSYLFWQKRYRFHIPFSLEHCIPFNCCESTVFF